MVDGVFFESSIKIFDSYLANIVIYPSVDEILGGSSCTPDLIFKTDTVLY